MMQHPLVFSMITKIKNLVREKISWWGNNSTRRYKAHARMCFWHDRKSQTFVHVLKEPTLKGIPPPTPVSTIIFFHKFSLTLSDQASYLHSNFTPVNKNIHFQTS